MNRPTLSHCITSFAFSALALVSLVAEATPKGTVPTNLVDIFSVDTSRTPWETLEVPQINAKIPYKPLFVDKETGQSFFLIRYKAGFMNTWHTHPAAHGMYVLDGVLKTHQGEFGPGSFVWFPEGGWMEHGATAKNDVTLLFFTNKKFGIHYEGDEILDYPMFKPK